MVVAATMILVQRLQPKAVYLRVLHYLTHYLYITLPVKRASALGSDDWSVMVFKTF